MKHPLPEPVLRARPHDLILVPSDAEVVLYVKEDEFNLGHYPTQCSLEFRLHVWDDRGIMVVVILVRLAGRNASTFDRWLNPAAPPDLRFLQLLASQRDLNLYLVSDRSARSFRQRNRLAGKAAATIATLKLRRSWSTAAFEELRRRYDALYRTADALWRGTREQRRGGPGPDRGPTPPAAIRPGTP
jgi:hypothetical protein